MYSILSWGNDIMESNGWWIKNIDNKNLNNSILLLVKHIDWFIEGNIHIGAKLRE